MCMSRLHRVVSVPGGRTEEEDSESLAEPGLVGAGVGAVEVEDMDGRRYRVSLLALDGPAPAVGEWLVVHSGYAVGRADAVEAEQVAAELRAAAHETPEVQS